MQCYEKDQQIRRRKYVLVDDVRIAYTDTGKGQPVLFVHGFGAYSVTWDRIISCLPQKKRFIALDLKGFGYSDKPNDGVYTPYAHAIILEQFVKQLNLKNIILVGHSFGGGICLLTVLSKRITHRIGALILIDSVGYFQNIPSIITTLRIPIFTQVALETLDPHVLVRKVLEKVYYDNSRISDETVNAYANVLNFDDARMSLMKSAHQFVPHEMKNIHKLFHTIELPTLIIWGLDDVFVPLDESYKFKRDIPHAQLAVLSECGHSPHEERPVETAAHITTFLTSGMKHITRKSKFKKKRIREEVGPERKIVKMRRLIDKWSFSVFILYVLVKGLHLLRSLGVSSKEAGWRKATRTYLQTEHSKFALAAFRLDVWSNAVGNQAKTFESVQRHIIERIATFLKKNPACHWQVELRRFSLKRAKKRYIDIVHARFNSDNSLASITPYLDTEGGELRHMDEQTRLLLNKEIVAIYNQTKDIPDKRRPRMFRTRINELIIRYSGLLLKTHVELFYYTQRLLSATFISFEEKPLSTDMGRSRFNIPKFIDRKHPGLGLFNIICRVNTTYTEADVWVQVHHVPVDGMPMQEILQAMKKEWGTIGELRFPSLSYSQRLVPENCSVQEDGNVVCNARAFFDFRPFLRTRKMLIEKYGESAGGDITAVSMLIWGLGHRPGFRDRKFVFPIDLFTSNYDKRIPGFVFIRPGIFIDVQNPLEGFLKFQREFNHRLYATKRRQGESYELLEVYALLSPFMYRLTHKLFPQSLAEFIGTVGITIIRDADFFIAPYTDIHTNGFFAFGNFLQPTEDNEMAGAVSVTGAKKSVEQYLNDLRAVLNDFEQYI